MGVGAIVGVALVTIQAAYQAPLTTMSASAPSVPANHVYLFGGAGTITGGTNLTLQPWRPTGRHLQASHRCS